MKKFCFTLFCFLLMSACNASAELNLSERDNDKQITASTGDIITISLNANATTGYSWKFTGTPSSAYEVIDESYKVNPHPEGMVGVGGKTFYKIKLLQKGKLIIKAQYFRPWEEFNPQTDKNLRFIIEIK